MKIGAKMLKWNYYSPSYFIFCYYVKFQHAWKSYENLAYRGKKRYSLNMLKITHSSFELWSKIIVNYYFFHKLFRRFRSWLLTRNWHSKFIIFVSNLLVVLIFLKIILIIAKWLLSGYLHPPASHPMPQPSPWITHVGRSPWHGLAKLRHPHARCATSASATRGVQLTCQLEQHPIRTQLD